MQVQSQCCIVISFMLEYVFCIVFCFVQLAISYLITVKIINLLIY